MEFSLAEKYKQITTADIAELLGVSKATVWRYVNRGILPQPQYISPKRPKWKLGEVIEVYEAHLSGVDDVVEVGGLARATQSKTTHNENKNEKPQSTAQKLKKRFGLS